MNLSIIEFPSSDSRLHNMTELYVVFTMIFDPSKLYFSVMPIYNFSRLFSCACCSLNCLHKQRQTFTLFKRIPYFFIFPFLYRPKRNKTK